MWLLVYAGIEFADAIKALVKCYIFMKSSNPVRGVQKVDLIFGCLFFNFRIAWLIYGNTFVYTEEMLDCKEESRKVRGLWILMVIVIAFGYLYFLLYGLILCCGSILLCCLCCHRDQLNRSQFVDKVPYLNAL